jgi:hypothetical protein
MLFVFCARFLFCSSSTAVTLRPSVRAGPADLNRKYARTGQTGIHRTLILCHSDDAHHGFSPHLDDGRVLADIQVHLICFDVAPQTQREVDFI